VKKVQILNRGDCCGNRLNNGKVFVGSKLCGNIKNPGQGKWNTQSCNLSGKFVKVQAAPHQYLTFCGIKVFGRYVGSKPKPRPTGRVRMLLFKSSKLSSIYIAGKTKSSNPYSTNTFTPQSARWNYKTCTCTKPDRKGAWW